MPSSSNYPVRTSMAWKRQERTFSLAATIVREPRTLPPADSLYLLNHPTKLRTILLIFQVAWNKSEHDVNIKGLENMKALAPDALVYCVIIPPKV